MRESVCERECACVYVCVCVHVEREEGRVLTQCGGRGARGGGGLAARAAAGRCGGGQVGGWDGGRPTELGRGEGEEGGEALLEWGEGLGRCVGGRGGRGE